MTCCGGVVKRQSLLRKRRRGTVNHMWEKADIINKPNEALLHHGLF
jgi:hypothetical protein